MEAGNEKHIKLCGKLIKGAATNVSKMHTEFMVMLRA